MSDPILCDYCPELASRMIQRGPRRERSFMCDVHRENAYERYPPLPGRSRFEELDRDSLEELWRTEWRRSKRNQRARERRKRARSVQLPSSPGGGR